MSNSLKTLTLIKRWDHHTTSGGYDALVNYLQGEKIYSKKNDKDRRSIKYRIWNRLVPSAKTVNQYQITDMSAELKTFYKVFREDFDIVHSLYAEDQLNLGLMKFRVQSGSFLSLFNKILYRFWLR